MDLHKLNPWNWFKHEESRDAGKQTVPIKREDYPAGQGAADSIRQLHREIDRLFDDAFRGYGFPSLARSPVWNRMPGGDFMASFRADLNVASDDKQYTITLEAPGLEQKDLSIELRERVLVIKGNKQQESEDKDKHYYRIERRYGAFERVLAVPDDADLDGISAGMDKGLLTVKIPRKPVSAAGVKRITIEKG